MPFRIVSRDGKFCVAKADSGEVLNDACHETREAAKAQLTAIMLSELRSQGRGPAKMSATVAFALGETVAEDDGYIYRAGKIFEAGEYQFPNQPDFIITPEELAATAAAFEPANLDLEHVPTVLDGKLGRLEAVEATEDGTLYGVTALPQWLDDLLTDGERKVSATLDRATKRIAGLALVRSPRVTDAALMAAFTQSTTAAPSGRKGTKPMTLWEKFKAALGAVEVGDDEPLTLTMAGTPAPSLPPPAAGLPSQPPAPPAENLTPTQAEFNRALLADNAAMRRALFTTQAEAWVETLLRDDRIAPVEKSGILAFYAHLAEEEVAGSKKVSFGADPLGNPAGDGNRLEAFRALYERRPKQGLLLTDVPPEYQVLFNPQATLGQDKLFTPEEAAAFKAMTPLGQALLDREKGR